MNERIKELAEQAERLAEDELAHLERVHNRLYSFTEGREIYNQKFAELIVRECIASIENADNGFEDYRNQIEDGMRNHCIDLIKNKFGVEE